MQQRGLQLPERDVGNIELPTHPGLILKASDSRWPRRNRVGYPIDFFMQVLGTGFHDAMRQVVRPV